MKGWAPLLAQVNEIEVAGGRPLPGAKGTSPVAFDALLIVFCGVCLTLLFVPWAVRIWRRKGRRQRRYKRVQASGVGGAVTAQGRRVRGQRPRNPTLAEVGGLPPLRAEEGPTGAGT